MVNSRGHVVLEPGFGPGAGGGLGAPAAAGAFDECLPAGDGGSGVLWLVDGELVLVADAVGAEFRAGESPVQAMTAELADLAAVADDDVSGVDAYQLGELIAGCQRVMSQARALQAKLVTELSRRPEMTPRPSAGPYRSVTSQTCTAVELTDPLKLTSGQAEHLVAESVQLVQDFPATHAALAEGRVDERRVRVILAELGRQDRDVASAVEAAVIDRAGELDARQLRRKIKDLVHRLAPVAATERRARAEADRRVRTSPAADGMAWIEALVRAEDAAAAEAVLDAGEKALKRLDTEHGNANARTRDQRRADVFAGLALSALAAGRVGGAADTCAGPGVDGPTSGDGDDGPERGTAAPAHTSRGPCGPPSPLADVIAGLVLSGAHGRPVTVHLTVPFTSAMGLDDQPGYLHGYGPFPADVARELAAAGVWQWVGTDPVTGVVRGHGRTRYVPPRDLVDHVILRDRTCKASGCEVPATDADIDHVIAHGAGGPTDGRNLCPFCRKHHLIKHHGPFDVDQPEPGLIRWASPTGRVITVGKTKVGPVPEQPPPRIEPDTGDPDHLDPPF